MRLAKPHVSAAAVAAAFKKEVPPLPQALMLLPFAFSEQLLLTEMRRVEGGIIDKRNTVLVAASGIAAGQSKSPPPLPLAGTGKQRNGSGMGTWTRRRKALWDINRAGSIAWRVGECRPQRFRRFGWYGRRQRLRFESIEWWPTRGLQQASSGSGVGRTEPGAEAPAPGAR